ncbi:MULTISPECIES: hypothetical protein [Streptomyces]|uniref:hypothetical protein n=1 Tax=Streptomyces TaxID=1883 RepID=UPI000241B725|nr:MULTISPECIES: hypothetical protein [Streptomyces]EHM23977.1 hypothetical protein SPW_7727 [Streptomyces sp. W007]WSI78237.1 hypothetical protein OG557_15340 [Streptomyces anulatus]WSU74235.1 hypothetical protein OG499_15310 [Streptomyces anulatus]WTD10496.1 hypothetical protein OHA54_15135 [Streptomyces anulatus]WTD27411.1 hypothetical protein OH737_24125 [Streptomyces anulatus]
MTTGRSRLAPGERVLPTDRLRADRQLPVIKALCAADQPLTAAALHQLTGAPATRCGLVPAFLITTGLVAKAPSQTGYLPTEKGRGIGRAWAEGEPAGLKALREAWKGQWFARTVLQFLGEGPRSREHLVGELSKISRAPEGRTGQVHVLVDLLVAIGMLFPEGDGMLSGRQGAHGPVPLLAQDQPLAGGDVASGQEAGPKSEAKGQPPAVPVAAWGELAEQDGLVSGVPTAARVPEPRRHQTLQTGDGPAPDLDLLALLLPPVLLADLARLSAEDLMALHGHLRGLAEITTKLRGRPVA